MKLFLSTPCYGGLCLETYAKSIINLQMAFIKEGIELYIDTTENESLVHRARNVSVGRFMQKSDAEYFMFIDADIHFDAQSVINLIKSGHDISVACYPKKYVDWNQAAKAIKTEDVSNKSMAMLSSSLVVNFGANIIQVENSFIPILDGPTGFMLIKRDVFEKMQDHYTDLWCVNDHQNRDFDKYCALFDCMIDPDSKRYLSEDYAFCRRWQQMGGKIHAHIQTTLGHVGNLPFSGCLDERLKVLNTCKGKHESVDSSSNKK
jgi:cellulose synthase/poly-beta-1,6-N-acetylglucosamine synthase-like glycosyltransferase